MSLLSIVDRKPDAQAEPGRYAALDWFLMDAQFRVLASGTMWVQDIGGGAYVSRSTRRIDIVQAGTPDLIVYRWPSDSEFTARAPGSRGCMMRLLYGPEWVSPGMSITLEWNHHGGKLFTLHQSPEVP